MKDYVSDPKADGYRGIHLVYKYKSGPKNIASITNRKLKFKSDHDFSTHGQPPLKLSMPSLVSYQVRVKAQSRRSRVA